MQPKCSRDRKRHTIYASEFDLYSLGNVMSFQVFEEVDDMMGMCFRRVSLGVVPRINN